MLTVNDQCLVFSSLCIIVEVGFIMLELRLIGVPLVEDNRLGLEVEALRSQPCVPEVPPLECADTTEEDER